MEFKIKDLLLSSQEYIQCHSYAIRMHICICMLLTRMIYLKQNIFENQFIKKRKPINDAFLVHFESQLVVF